MFFSNREDLVHDDRRLRVDHKGGMGSKYAAHSEERVVSDEGQAGTGIYINELDENLRCYIVFGDAIYGFLCSGFCFSQCVEVGVFA